MKKRILSILFTILMAVALVPFAVVTALADDDPAFITEPTGGYVAEGEKHTITWETNFEPVWIQVLVFSSANGAPSGAIEVPDGATSFELEANEYGYALEEIGRAHV